MRSILVDLEGMILRKNQDRTTTRHSDLDDLDRRILRELTVEPDATIKALAHRLGLAESTCAYRLRAMREAGLVGTRLELDLSALGYHLQAIVKVRLGSHNRELVNRLYDDLAAAPGVLRAYHLAGADDFHLHVAATDAEALRDLVLNHVTIHQVVRGTETQIIFELRETAGVSP